MFGSFHWFYASLLEFVGRFIEGFRWFCWQFSLAVLSSFAGIVFVFFFVSKVLYRFCVVCCSLIMVLTCFAMSE